MRSIQILRTAARQISTMGASRLSTDCSPFTQAVVSSMRKLYPEELADKSFDNTGLLLEAPLDTSDAPRRQKNSVLLAIDLTKAVADEAIENKNSVIVAYHPIIFRGLKSITLADSQQKSLLRLAQHGISVYSPHTAVDTVPGGMGDWLCDVVTGNFQIATESKVDLKKCDSSDMYTAPTYPESAIPVTDSKADSNPRSQPHTRSTIHPSPAVPIPQGFESAGAGRLVEFETAQSLGSLTDNIAHGIGMPGGIPIAIPQGSSVDTIEIRTVGMCPGSGSSVLLRGGEIPDLLLTGEMSHHEALAATERGSAVICLSHTNSERGYLRSVMQAKLLTELTQCWAAWNEEAKNDERNLQSGATITPGASLVRELYETQGEVRVSVSKADRDPYGIMLWRGN